MHDEDTKPKPPAGLQQAILEDTSPNQPAPFPETMPPLLDPDGPRGRLSWLLALLVIAASSFMCLAIIVLSGFAGVRDELKVIGTEAVQTKQADVATQYARANNDFDAQRYELAEIRYEYVETKIPGYEVAAARLQQVREILTYTATPTATIPVPTETPQPTLATTVEGQATPAAPVAIPTGPNPEELYGQAVTAMSVYLYEDAIRWLDALRAVAPNYRRAEVNEMLIQALTLQGSTYLRGRNTDGEDRLAQGVQMIDRAADLGYDGDLIYEADFVSRYMSARAYIEGGLYDQAIPVLTQLCNENCDWAYQGVSIRAMMSQIGAGQ